MQFLRNRSCPRALYLGPDRGGGLFLAGGAQRGGRAQPGDRYDRRVLVRVTEPGLRPIRNAVPKLGGIDISPVILFLIIMFIRYVIALYILPYVY